MRRKGRMSLQVFIFQMVAEVFFFGIRQRGQVKKKGSACNDSTSEICTYGHPFWWRVKLRHKSLGQARLKNFRIHHSEHTDGATFVASRFLATAVSARLPG
jgi:uncharacterized membrane protein